ncbi:MAG: uncharacterized protein K0S47_3427 [Herbinix sp.]|jgi:flavodoxin|nr:uncharacterized protein [Herbinix sp.]
MNTALIYYSKTGHTKMIAKAMGEEIGIEAQNILEKPVINNVDILLIGSGIYAGKVAEELITFIQELDPEKVKRAVIFTTAMTETIQTATLKSALFAKGIPVEGEEFICKGKFLFFSKHHPNELDIKKAKEFVKKYTNK